ncbi:MAG: riboflavin biosynthesis protein RibF [Planctomycetota bacterium]
MTPHALTIGSFDGVHAGHAGLIARAREIAGRSGRVTVLAFDPHPRSVISTAPARLTTWPTRERMLLALGADEVLRLEPTEALLSLDPEQFVDTRIAPLRPTAVVEGHDFRFGRRRAGDVGVLAALGEGYGFELHLVDAVTASIHDRGGVPVSSSLIRSLLRHGRVRDITRLLGRPYRLEGEVVRGDRLGRTIGCPTANLDPLNHPPGAGVYAAFAETGDGRRFPAAVNIGARPTVGGIARRVEAHLIGAPRGDGGTIERLDEYGWRLSLDFVSRLRDEVRFPSLEALKDQLTRDIQRAADAAPLAAVPQGPSE